MPVPLLPPGPMGDMVRRRHSMSKEGTEQLQFAPGRFNPQFGDPYKAPKEGGTPRGPMARNAGDVIEGPWNKNPVRQIDPIAQGMQDRGLPVPSGGRGGKAPSAKDSAQTSFPPAGKGKATPILDAMVAKLRNAGETMKRASVDTTNIQKWAKENGVDPKKAAELVRGAGDLNMSESTVKFYLTLMKQKGLL